MPVLENVRHERFAQELAKGKTQDQSYVDAGYKHDYGAASRLSRNVKIQERVKELQERAAIRVEWDIKDAISELEEARIAAKIADTVQASAMINATMGKAKLLGLVVDKQDSNVNVTLSFEDQLKDLA